MRPDRLVISAWGPYKDRAEIDFRDFQGEGLFLITGATGAGKTTIFDAITYALYGALSGQMREKGTVRSDFAAGDVPAFVELTMTHCGKEYRILRNPEYLRPKKKKNGKSEWTKEKENAVLYLPEGQIIEGVREVGAKLSELLVLDYYQFKQISMLAQGEFSRMLTASAKEKISIFREIFGTGIYEKFTQILRGRASDLYVRAAEQKHKLEEDVKLLLSAVEENSAQGRALQELTEGEHWNYGAIQECLSGWQMGLQEQMQENALLYESLDNKTHELTEELAKGQEINRKLEQWNETCRKLQELLDKKEDYLEKEETLKRASLAAAAQTKEIIWQSFCDQAKRVERALADLEQEKQKLRSERERLQVYSVNREQIEAGLLLWEQVKKTESDLAQCHRQVCEMESRYQQEQRTYLALEMQRDETKRAYEEADRAYKHAVIGLAAKLLIPGSPCPVCGSKDHPQPAAPAEGILSEEQLHSLQKELEQKEQLLLSQQQRVVELQTRYHSLQQQEESLGTQLKHLELAYGEKESLLSEKQVVLGELTNAKLRELLQEFDRVSGLLQSKDQEWQKNTEQQKVLGLQIAQSRSVFEDALKEFDFQGEEAYHRSLLSVTERSELERQITQYKERVAGCINLKEHLEAETAGWQTVALEDTQTALQQARTQKEQTRELQEQTSSLADAVCRTLASMKDKQKILEKISEEYGYVKDLDNLASGNNRRKLVFEQYVLVGYFEEILRAANLRFSRMTGGRYEMWRMEEASDGRSKDSLEIEVMDYYTGKRRSVKTLSGGESFKASLSLALGLRDVIQATSGGIQVDAMFVDEGFGALDSESLDQACETLQSLAEPGQMIGIISHVQELRERIHRQILVEKTNQGSRIRV